MLIFAKFIPGINTMAPPLAGSMNMRVAEFLGLDVVGAALYTGAFWGAGFLFSGFIGMIADVYSRFGNALAMAIGLMVIAWLAYHAVQLLRARRLSPVARVSVAEIARRRGEVAIFDVRSHGYYEKNAMRIEGSERLEPNAVTQVCETIPKDRDIVLYCTCYREVTSERVARFLAENGGRATVIAGGFQAWKKAGLPVEPVPAHDIVQLPKFS